VKAWVTRTEPGASTLADALRSNGYSVLKAPVLEIRPTSFGPVEGPFEIGLFLSVAGVRIAAADVAQHAEALYAVGLRTREALRAQGFDARVPDLETSEGLLQALGDVSQKKVLIVTGVGGRNLLADALQARGAAVTRLDVYVRYPLTPEVDVGAVKLIVTSSGDGLRQAERVWTGAGGDSGIPVLTPSSRVAAIGAELGLYCVYDCGGAGSEAVLRTLERLDFEQDNWQR